MVEMVSTLMVPFFSVSKACTDLPRRSVRVRFQQRRQSVWRGLGGESLGLATLPVTCGLLLLHHVKRVVL
ncbi:hypothetical protein O3P69_013531 [Scylla paramamosain]|uniref:Uncharacterized protein n=1 Tax=Scylla paramamosain TaxID=85552 RepID=A0AAW0SHS4_SCYPA